MRNFTPLIIVLIVLFIGLLSPRRSPALLSDPPRVSVESVSYTRTSDGSMVIYCMFQNKDSIPVSNVVIDLFVVDSAGQVLQSKELVFFTKTMLEPSQKALFSESFPECWDCVEAKAAIR